jgi:hypothetical protein
MDKKIHYYGNKEHGYSVDRGAIRAAVRRVEGGWEGSYAGAPRIHNPWVPHPDGGRSRSCTPPKIVVGIFRTRQLAAEAALDAKLKEEQENGLFPKMEKSDASHASSA